MVNKIFEFVVFILKRIGEITGLTYNEVNIIIYFIIIPFSWLCMLDIIFDVHFFKIGFFIFLIGFLIGCRDFKTYSNWLYSKSVNFLLSFKKFNVDYFKASVWICVSLPLLIYILLIVLIFK